MAKKKASSNTIPPAVQSVQKGSDDPFPLLKYFSLVVTQALLLLFSMLILPRSTLTFKDLPPQTSSLDRPQSEFMAPITAWPALSVAWISLGAAFVQLYWGSRATTWIEYDVLKETGAHRDDAKLHRNDHSKRDLAKAWGITLLGALVYYAVVVSFGAPLATHLPHTFTLALLLSILSVYAPARGLTLPSAGPQQDGGVALKQKWSRIFIHLRPKTGAERALLYPSLFTIFGAWCGAYPLALDWDRPWQAWPLTPAIGAIVGYITGSLTSAFVSGIIYLANTVEEPRKAQ